MVRCRRSDLTEKREGRKHSTVSAGKKEYATSLRAGWRVS
jgi:hypothetical protein